MNYLRNKTVYLCGPIHAVSDDGTEWRNWITPKLIETFGLIVDDPCKKSVNGLSEVKEDKKYIKKLIKEENWQKVKETFYPIIRKDLRSVDKADFLIVTYDPSIHMLGTIHEMCVADSQKKPILIWFDKKHTEILNPWVFTFSKSSWIFTNWNKMFEYLHQVDGGNFDSSHWTL